MRMVSKMAGNNWPLYFADKVKGKVICHSLWHEVGGETFQQIPTLIWHEVILEELHNENG